MGIFEALRSAHVAYCTAGKFGVMSYVRVSYSICGGGIQNTFYVESIEQSKSL